MNVTSAVVNVSTSARGRLSVVAVVLGVVVAVLAGLLVGAAVRSEPSRAPAKRAETVSAAGVRLQLPSGWARGDVSTVPGFGRALSLRNPEHDLRAAVALFPASSPTLLPAASPVDARVPETVRLRSGYEAWRYRGSLDDGSPVLLYATPTTTGIATVACVGANASAACDALASAVAVPSSRRLKLDKRAAFFSGLPSVVDRLDAARTRGMRTLAEARRPLGQELAASDLARAHKAAAADLAALSSPGDRVAERTVAALTGAATAYGALSRAASARLRQPYVDAGRAVTGAEADLQRAMTKVAAGASSAIAVPNTAPSQPQLAPPKATATAEPPKATATAEPPKPTATATAEPPKPTATAAPPKATATAEPPKATATARAAEPLAGSREKSSGGLDLTLPLLILIAVGAIVIAGRSMRSSWSDATAESRGTRA